MNELQGIYKKQMQEVRKLYPPVISAILENIANGDTVAVAVDKGFKSTYYEAEVSELTVGNMMSASGAGLGEQLTLNTNLARDYFLFTKFSDGVSLSDTLHSGEAQQAVKGVLNNYFKFKGNAQELTAKLKNINRFPNTNIPKEINELVRLSRGVTDLKGSRVFEQQLNKAYASISKLDKRQVTQTRDLKKAYTKLIKTVETGEVAQVDKALDYAFGKKVEYINSRIARTEFAQAYEMSFQRQMEEDSAIVGYQWLLSSAHPVTDICDCYAEADMYGMGAGIYPKDAGANVPAHPNCLCSKVPVYDAEKKGRFSKERVNKYLNNLSDSERKRVLGAKNSQKQKDYEKGLNKMGFQITKKPRMISKSIIKKAGKNG